MNIRKSLVAKAQSSSGAEASSLLLTEVAQELKLQRPSRDQVLAITQPVVENSKHLEQPAAFNAC
jgi:hypothetical protein